MGVAVRPTGAVQAFRTFELISVVIVAKAQVLWSEEHAKEKVCP
jgi:hypothetical protein